MDVISQYSIHESNFKAMKDKDVVVLSADLTDSVRAHWFKKEFPDRIFNMGIMEQGTVGIAAGMAMAGLIPIVYSIVNFIAYRAFEQIRNDVILQNLNVKFIATGANNYFKFLGPSHCCGEEDKKIMQLINMRVFDPFEQENIDFNKMIQEWITDTKAGYIRV